MSDQPIPPTSTNGVYTSPRLPDEVMVMVMEAMNEVEKQDATGYPMSERCGCGPQLRSSPARFHRYGGRYCRRYRRAS